MNNFCDAFGMLVICPTRQGRTQKLPAASTLRGQVHAGTTGRSTVAFTIKALQIGESVNGQAMRVMLTFKENLLQMPGKALARPP